MNDGGASPVASIFLAALLAGLFAYDWATTKGHRRLLAIEAVVFAVGGVFVARPQIATSLAHAVGIGRGVDFVLYPAVVWLVRDSLRWRRLRHDDRLKFTALVRALAMKDAETKGAVDAAGLGDPKDPSP